MVETENEKVRFSEASVIQWLLDIFYSIRRWLVTRLAFYSLRLYGLEGVTLSDVERGSYSHHQHQDRSLENSENLDDLRRSSRECLDNANARRRAITDKCKTLLTMSSLLLGLASLLLPKSFAFDFAWMRTIGFLAVLCLMNTVTLLLIFFDVGRDTEISIEQDDVDLDSNNFTKNLINLYLRCQIDMDNRTNYLVDLYKAARFFVLLSLTVFIGLFFINFVYISPKDQSERIVRQLRSDPVLIELLRGPKGKKGDRGNQGLQGKIGLKGDSGLNGQDAVFDDEKFIRRLLTDPRLMKKIGEAISNQKSTQSK